MIIFFLYTIEKEIHSIKENEVCVKFKLHDKNLEFKLDTGAQVNCIPLREFEAKLGDKVTLDTSNLATLSSYSGNALDVKGKCTVSCQWKSSKQDLEF